MTTGKRLINLALAGALIVTLSGCEFAFFRHEAGEDLDEGAFGNPTMTNHLVMTGQAPYVSELSGRFVREVPTTINFAFDSAALDAQARAVLRQQAQWIIAFPEVRFSVYGHTDLVGSDSYNQGLGLRRAQAAVDYLVSQGVERDRLEALVSLGETQPLVASESRELRNRRTVTEVQGFVQTHPMVLDGRYADIVYRAYAGPRPTGGN
jgi:outer membrane protein OmpA-like peptidoglycan-associated protein